LALAYGTRIDRLLGSAARIEDLGRDLGAGLTEREVDYLVREEWARSADDILWRRSKLGLHGGPALAANLTEYLAQSKADALPG
jgi:glycerol-3-phosphate dehydrogenase